jgi:ligand-binding sensor domain-containing protein
MLVAGSVAGSAHTALELERLAAPSFESFGARDGLPDGVITAIGVDGEGFAWAGSPRGLFRFVGHRWQHRLGSEYGKTHRRMTLDSHGTFWTPTADAGLVAQIDGKWRHLQREGEVPIDSIYRIEQTATGDGRVRTWMLGWNGGLFERRDGEWLPDPGSDSLPKELLLSIERTETLYGETRYWIGTGTSGVWFRPEGQTNWQPFRDTGVQGGQVEDIQRSVDARGEALWISVFGHGLWRLDRDGMRAWRMESGELRSNQLYTIAVEDAPDGEAVAWVASRGGLLRVRGDRLETYGQRHGLPSDRVRSTHLWRSPQGERVLWIATEAGVARAVLSAERWRTVSLAGAGSIGVFGVLFEADERGTEQLWLTSYGDGLGLYRNGHWQHFTTRDGSLPHDSGRLIARAVDFEGRNALWLGLDSGQLMRVEDGPAFVDVPVPWPQLPGNAPLAVLSRRVLDQPELWFATRLSGLYRWQRDGWSAFRPDGFSGDLGAQDLVEQIDAAGRSWLWVSTTRGLARFDGERLELLLGIDGLAERVLLGLSLRREADGRQTLWIGSQFDGLMRLDVSDPRQPRLVAPDRLPPPIYSMVYSALHDSQGRIYLCTNDGVQQLTPRADGGWDEAVFRRSDGMVHEECNSGAQFIDRYDRFWTGTLGGLTVSIRRRRALPTPSVWS